jgi:uncharacterized damage-inducible protein DinB
MTIDVYLANARSGRVMAHVLEPPGLGRCFADRARLEAELPGVVEAHLAWLERKGAWRRPATPIVTRVVEEDHAEGDFQSGDDVGTFQPDFEPLTVQARDRYLAIAAHAHDDLLAMVSSAPAELLLCEPRPGVRSLGANLRHVARAEIWYLTRIIDDPDVQGMPAVIERADREVDASSDGAEQVRIAWDAFQRFSRALDGDALARTFVPTWFCSISTERWSARKALRRCIEHCREHTWVIERALRMLT